MKIKLLILIFFFFVPIVNLAQVSVGIGSGFGNISSESPEILSIPIIFSVRYEVENYGFGIVGNIINQKKVKFYLPWNENERFFSKMNIYSIGGFYEESFAGNTRILSGIGYSYFIDNIYENQEKYANGLYLHTEFEIIELLENININFGLKYGFSLENPFARFNQFYIQIFRIIR